MLCCVVYVCFVFEIVCMVDSVLVCIILCVEGWLCVVE